MQVERFLFYWYLQMFLHKFFDETLRAEMFVFGPACMFRKEKSKTYKVNLNEP